MEGRQATQRRKSQEKSFEAIIHTFRAINEAKRLKADILHIHAIGPALLIPYAKMLGMKVVLPTTDRIMTGTNGEWLQRRC